MKGKWLHEVPRIVKLTVTEQNGSCSGQREEVVESLMATGFQLELMRRLWRQQW